MPEDDLLSLVLSVGEQESKVFPSQLQPVLDSELGDIVNFEEQLIFDGVGRAVGAEAGDARTSMSLNR